MTSGERTAAELAQEADELVVRAKSDRTAFSELYQRYYPEVARYCLRRMFSRALAEDALSDVFLEVAEHLPAFAGTTDTDFRRWLFRIATNVINAHWRKSLRRDHLLIEAVQSGRWKAPTETQLPQGESEAGDWPTVYRAVMELPERERTIVMLRFFSNCSHDEIAEIVSATPGAVRLALSRTLARLRARFNPTKGTPPKFSPPSEFDTG